MQAKDTDINAITPYYNNPRDNKAAIPGVAESIKAFGFLQPIVTDKNGVIIVGHTRWAAAKRLGLKSVPVITADYLTPEQVRAYRLADNKTGETAKWDNEALISEIEALNLADMDISNFGFNLDPEQERRQAWLKVKKLCNLEPALKARERNGVIITEFFHCGKTGADIRSIKENPDNVKLFAATLTDYIIKSFGDLQGGGWALITALSYEKLGFYCSKSDFR